MSKSHHEAIRGLLRRNPDGMTTSELAECMRHLDPPINVADTGVNVSLKSMWDAYIDRWTPANPGVWAAVWCVVIPPENCPKPEGPPNPSKRRKRSKPCPTQKLETE